MAGTEDSDRSGQPQGPSPELPWYYARHWVFILIFLVAGALALPCLWFSPRFGAKEKFLWSVVGVLYSAILVALMIWIILYLWQIMIELPL
jgi:hypothetical protein